MDEQCSRRECDYWDADYDQYCKAKGGQVRIAPFCDDYKPYTALKVQKMDDEAFYRLICELWVAHQGLEALQDAYRRETGRSWVPAPPYEPDKEDRWT